MPHTPGHVVNQPPSGYQQVFEDGRYRQVLPSDKPSTKKPGFQLGDFMSNLVSPTAAITGAVAPNLMDQLANMFRSVLEETTQANKDLFTQTQAVTQAAGKQLGEAEDVLLNARKEYLASGKEHIKASPGGRATAAVLTNPMVNRTADMLPPIFLTNLLNKLMERIQAEGIGQKAMEGLQMQGQAMQMAGEAMNPLINLNQTYTAPTQPNTFAPPQLPYPVPTPFTFPQPIFPTRPGLTKGRVDFPKKQSGIRPTSAQQSYTPGM
jgi:hypothetical protein